MKQRIFEISQASGMEVSKKEATCFIHQLAKDASKPQTKQLFKWRIDPDAGVDAGPGAFCSEGLTEGSLIKLCAITEDGKTGVQFAFFKHGVLWYMCKEFGGDNSNDMHLACLYKMVSKAVHVAEPEVTPTSASLADASKKPDPLAQLREDIDKKYQKPQQELPKTRVADMFRKVTAEQISNRILRQPSMLSINVAEGSPEFYRLETLIRAVVSYIQAVRPKETRYLLRGYALRSATGDHRVCNHIMLSPMADIANAYVELDDKYYGGLKPAEQTEKFVADVVVNMLIGI